MRNRSSQNLKSLISKLLGQEMKWTLCYVPLLLLAAYSASYPEIEFI